MSLTSLIHNYNGAQITGFSFGPRREMTLNVSVLTWRGQTAQCGPTVELRFGAINNFEEAKEFLAAGRQQRSELALVNYSSSRPSKPGNLFIDVVFERIDAKFCISCGSVTVKQIGSGPAAP